MPRELVLNAPTCSDCGGLTRPPAGSHPVQNCNCHETAFDDDEDDRPPRTSRDRAIANSLQQMSPLPSYLGAAGAPPETPRRVTTNQQGGVDLEPTQTWPPTINWGEVVQEQQQEDAQRARARRPVTNEDDLPGTLITSEWPPVIRW